MTWTFCTSGAAVAKMGANANSTITASGAALANWCDEAEAIINMETMYDLVTNYSSLGANYQNILQNICTSIIAQKGIMYDMSGFTQKREAETMLDVLENDIRRGLNYLEKDKYKQQLGASLS